MYLLLEGGFQYLTCLPPSKDCKGPFLFFVFEDPQTPRKRIIHFRDSQFFKGPHPNHWVCSVTPWHITLTFWKLHTPDSRNNPAKNGFFAWQCGAFLRVTQVFQVNMISWGLALSPCKTIRKLNNSPLEIHGGWKTSRLFLLGPR